MQATLHHPAADQHHRDSQSSPTRPTADDNHDHHDDHEDGQRSAPSTRPEAHQREAAVEGLISLSQLPPLMSSPLPSPSPPLRPLPPRKRKSPPLHPPPQQQRQRHQQHHHQQGARPGQPLLPSDTSQFSPAAAAARAPAFTPAVRSPPPPPPLPALGRVVAPYLTRGGAPTSPPPRPSSTTTTMVTPLLAPLPPLKRLRSIATARPGPGLLAPEAIPSSSTSSPTTAPTTTAAPAAIATASSTGTSTATAYEAQRSASVAFLDGHHVAPPPPQPPQPSSSPPPSSSSLAPPSRGEEAARHLRGSRRRRRRPRDEDYEDSEYDQDYDYQDDDHDDHEEEDDDDEEEEAPPLMVTRAATAPQLPGPAAGFGGGGEEEEERERRAVERCLDLGVERNVVEALSTAGVSAERIVELILSEDKEQREGIIRGTGLSKNYIMKLQRRALRTSAHLQLPSPLAHSFRSGLVLHVLFDSHDRALFIKKELCRLLNMKGTTFSYWKKKAGVSDIDTSQDFRLMDKCRSIFGGRSTYTLYSAEQMLTILQCMQRSRQKNCFTNVPELTALIASYHPQHHPQQQQQPHRFPSSALLPLLPALAGQPHHGSSGLLRAIDAAGDDDDHDDHDHLHEQQQREEEKKKEDEEQEARAEALTAALPLACPAAPDLLSGRTTTPSPPSPAPLTTTSAAAFPGPATDNGHFTAADPR